MTAQEVYDDAVKALPVAERLRLAALILNGIPSGSIIDYSDEWSDEDIHDIALYSFERAGKSFEETDDG